MRALLLRALAGLLRTLRPPTEEQPNTILVLQFMMPLGCCVHGTPLYAGLKKVRPNARLVVVTRGMGLSTLQHNPHIDVLLEAPAPGEGLRSLWTCSQSIRKMLRERGIRPGLILQDANNRRGSFALLASLLRLAPTAGFADLPELYDHPFVYDPSLSLIDNNLRLTGLLGTVSDHLEPEIFFTSRELAKAESLLAAANPSERPTVALVLAASGAQRTGWHDDRFAAVIRHIEQAGYRTVFPGTPDGQPTIDRIRSLAGSSGTSLAGRTNVPELAAMLCLCDLLITLDTGTLHVGRAVGVPMVVLGPSWQRPLEWLPLDVPNALILRGEDVPTVPENYLLDEIEADAVIQTADELLTLYPPAAEARNARVRARHIPS